MKKIGLAITGSFCTFKNILTAIETLKQAFPCQLFPIFSFNAATLDTKFGVASEYVKTVEKLCGNPSIKTIVAAEPIGTTMNLDLVIVAPCTGNTLGKIAAGITDTPVTMAVKAQLRNARPVLISISTNDGLAASAKNLGMLLNTKNIFFVPFGQDDPQNKTTSLIADTTLIPAAAKLALNGKQIQPIFA